MRKLILSSKVLRTMRLIRSSHGKLKYVITFGIVSFLYFIYVFFTQKQRHINSEILTDKPKIAGYTRGRTGNQMFGYASLIGIAHENNLIPVFDKSNMLWDVFKLPVHTGEFTPEVTIRQKSVGMYENIIENLEPKNTHIIGYWQSWKYFENVRKELITKHFVFWNDISSEADEFLHRALKEKQKNKDTILIGVHVRRGDFVRQRMKGFSAAPVSYYYKAMNYYRRKFSNLLFIIISNDVYWAEDHLDQGPEVYYSHNTPDKFDLDFAILCKCNHSIISSGSFSWWAGYLTGGEVVYYHLYPEENTKIGKHYLKKDYYPPHWIPY